MAIYPTSSGKIFHGSTKGFHRLGNFESFAEIDNYLKSVMREAYQETLNMMVEKLRKIIKEDVYTTPYTTKTMKYRNNANYKFEQKWGGRTQTLLDKESIETYIYNAFGKGIAGGIRFNDKPYYQNMNLKKFVHGNEYWGELAFSSYLEMLNNPRVLHDNPYGFPTFRDIHRDSFWYDFVKWANENFERIFTLNVNKLIGSKTVASSYIFDESENITNNSQHSMNLSNSTRRIRSLDTGTFGEAEPIGFRGVVSVEDEDGNVIQSTTYN